MDSNNSAQMKLARGYTFWFSGVIPTEEEGRDTKHVMESIADVETVQEFWAVYQHLNKPNEALHRTCFHFFQKGIKPIWEDEENKNGGRWHIWFPKGQTNKLWEDLLVYLIGNQFTSSDGICGIEVRIKPRGDSLSIWHKNSSDDDQKNNLKEEFLTAIGANDSGIKVEYHKFTESIEYEKSHREKKNTGFHRNVKDE
mmetsp:Transcript_20882/g.18507  ORF Transcript_20882/g.18507 Transcript_20882/m.18507 type:complete len:198 (-) Transcript_20882:45-638(-)